jgi:hypothetical protein
VRERRGGREGQRGNDRERLEPKQPVTFTELLCVCVCVEINV